MTTPISDNLKAFLDMLAWSEGTSRMPGSDNGYNVLVGSTSSHPLFFDSYATHPNILNHALDSTAAGRYQIIHPTFVSLCSHFGFTDFAPDTQDRMAIDLITGRSAMPFIESGNFALAVQKCATEWASLPGGTSGQHENQLAQLQQVYLDAGGSLSPDATT